LRSEDSPRARSDWRKGFREASPYIGLGMQLAMSMAFFTVGGYLLDRALDLSPWLTIVGGIVGMSAVFLQLVRVSRQMSRKTRSRKPE
jgi:F0F1-type ATP synthase assembly protein I